MTAKLTSKAVLRLFVGLTWSCLVARSAQISISSVAAPVGGNAAVDVTIAAQGDAVAGLQFDIVSDATLAISSTPGVVSANGDKSLSTATLGPGATRFLVVGLNQNVLGDGVLLSLEIPIPADTDTAHQVLHVANAVATDENGSPVLLSAVDGSISVNGPAPAIATVVNGASFLPSIVDGSWISILGSHLAATARALQTSDIIDGKLPTVADGVGVTVGGLPAAISYVSPTQINVQVPATRTIGTVDVIVTTAFGSSLSFRANVLRDSPGVFVFNPGDGRYPAAVIAQNDGGFAYLGPAGLFGTALATRPARPGEVLELYATGLGPTNPAVPAGQVFSDAAPTIDPVTVTIGGVNASVTFAGLTGAGLYQLNVTVPNLPAGEQPLNVIVNGAVSQPGVFVAVAP